MEASIVRPRRLLTGVLAACILVAALVATAAPPPAAAATESVLVARSAGDHDALWLLDPVTGAPTAAGALPGKAGDVAISPDGTNVAYLPRSGVPRVWIGYGPLAPRTISLAGLGVKRVHGLTWIDAERLVVAGAKRPALGEYGDRLYLVNVATGKVRSLRGLAGTEPFAAPAAGRLAYVQLTTVVPASAASGRSATIRESLKLLTMAGTGAGRTIASERYEVYAAYRAFAQPQVSPNGTWLLTGQTGSDVRVTYALRQAKWGWPFFTLHTVAVPAGGGWDASGQRVAFAGRLDPMGDSGACVWVYDVRTGSLLRSPDSLLPDAMILRLAWAPSGRLVADAWRAGGTRRDLVLSADLTSVTDIGTGSLPVWITR